VPAALLRCSIMGTRIGLLLVAGTLGACASSSGGFFEPTRAADQREAGSVHVAVLAVAPWSHYESALQPQFRLDAEDARDMVVRDTASGYESSERNVGLALGVTEDADEHSRREAPSTSSYSQTRLGGGSAGRSDAMLEYWAATALFQEVQLLNRSVRDAAIPSGYRAYLVRLQLSLMPRRRNEPYDTYTTLSFFRPDLAQPLADRDGSDARIHEPVVTSLRAASTRRTDLLPGSGPCVLPLVATDNLEASNQSRAGAETHRLALDFLGFPGDFATNLQAQFFQEQLQAQVNARDLNSLLTVARLSENSLRVRLGALQQATARYAMVPRNHYVTLLLMVPEEAPPVVDLVAQTTLVDAETGEELQATGEEHVGELLSGVAARLGRPELDPNTLQGLLSCVQRNDQEGYQELLFAHLGSDHGPELAHELWLELVQLMVGSQFASFRFELPGHGEWDIQPDEFYDQTPLAIDDGQGATVVALHGAEFGERIELTAMLRLEVEGREVSLPAESVEKLEREVRLSFPSLAALGLGGDAAQRLDLALRWAGEEASFQTLYVTRAAGAGD
jgi:hypothetical protein